MPRGDENDWQLPYMQQFSQLARAKGALPGQRNLLNRLLHEFAVDQQLPEDTRNAFSRICKQTQRGKSSFITMSVSRYWPVTIPPIGEREMAENAAQSSRPAPTPAKAVAKTATCNVGSVPDVDFVLSLRTDKAYESSQVAAILNSKFLESFPNFTIEILRSTSCSNLLDLKIHTNCNYSCIREELQKFPWIVAVAAKPASCFGDFSFSDFWE